MTIAKRHRVFDRQNADREMTKTSSERGSVAIATTVCLWMRLHGIVVAEAHVAFLRHITFPEPS